MKTMRIKMKRALWGIFSISLLLTFISCEKDEKNPDYAGTWVATGVIQVSEDLSFEYKDIMTFTANTFNDLGQIKNPNTNQWDNFVNLKGNISANGNTMNVTITEIGFTSLDMMTGMPTGTLVYYKENQSEFTEILTQIGMKKTFKSEYSVSGNTLTLKTDNNDDGDYNDEEEITIYTRQ